MSASSLAAPLLKKRPPEVGLFISAPVWLARHLPVAARGVFLMTPLDFRFLAVDQRDSVLLKGKELLLDVGPQSPDLQPQTITLSSPEGC